MFPDDVFEYIDDGCSPAVVTSFEPLDVVTGLRFYDSDIWFHHLEEETSSIYGFSTLRLNDLEQFMRSRIESPNVSQPNDPPPAEIRACRVLAFRIPTTIYHYISGLKCTSYNFSFGNDFGEKCTIIFYCDIWARFLSMYQGRPPNIYFQDFECTSYCLSLVDCRRY